MLKSVLFAILVLLIGLFATVLVQSPDAAAKQDPAAGEPGAYRGGACNFDEFTKAVLEVQKRRKSRLLTAEQFAKMAAEPGTIVLDARSIDSYEILRVKNSENLPYTNMGYETLRELIPKDSTRILIYCRNNIADGAFNRIQDAEPLSISRKAPAAGLNIPVAVTLFIYGYGNVWELDEIVEPDKCPIAFEWTPKAHEIAGSIGIRLEKK